MLSASVANAWWDCNWSKRVLVTINNTSGSTLTNYEVPFAVNAGNFPGYVFTNNDKDFRAVDTNDTTLLNYFVEQHQSATTGYTAWVKIPSLAAGASKTFYIYYVNAAAVSGSSAVNTFSQTGIRVWTRNSAADPSDRASYDTAFAAATDLTGSGYGCKIITDWTSVNNNSLFGPPSKNNDILWSWLAYFDASGNVGNWGFRQALDYGRGGALYIDDGIIQENWNADMYSANNYLVAANILSNNSVPLTTGYHALRGNGAEGCCDGAGSAQFKTPAGAFTNWNTTNLASTRAPQCRVNGVTTSLTPFNSNFSVSKTVLAFSDPVNNTTNPKYIPGARARYLITIANNGGSPADAGTIFITDPIPANTQLFVGDLGVAGSGPVKFTQGAPTSALTYSFSSLASAADDVSFSNNSGASYVYTPVNTGGFDANVTNISINPKNAFACSTTGSTPTAQFEFDVGIK
ncbi:MAG: CCXG family PEP-CTERM protein [Bdellovibrio sp.]|nr:CCXG family PEP-CTERM protein [Methylotenera sp.]